MNLSNAAPELPDEWKELYQQAILEPEYVRLSERISKARTAIVHRILRSSSNEENDKLKRALRTLQILGEVILRRTVDPQLNRDYTTKPIQNRTAMNKKSADTLSAGLGGASLCGSIEHALNDAIGLGAVGTTTKNARCPCRLQLPQL